jgi:hypothetical protein
VSRQREREREREGGGEVVDRRFVEVEPSANRGSRCSALDKNEYNHITATYFLLAERKLRAHRQEQMQKTRPEVLDVSSRYVSCVESFMLLIA